MSGATVTGVVAPESASTIPPEERYENLGGVYFPILQQDGRRVMTKVGNGKDAGSFLFLRWLRQHDRRTGGQTQ